MPFEQKPLKKDEPSLSELSVVKGELYSAFLSGSEETKKRKRQELIEKYGSKRVLDIYDTIAQESIIDINSGLPRSEAFSRQLDRMVDEEMLGKDGEASAMFFRTGGDEFAGLVRAKGREPLMIYCDLARLNLYNALGGHEGGDEVIKNVGQKLSVARERINLQSPDQELEKNLRQMVVEGIAKISVAEMASLPANAPEVHLDFGVARFSEAKDIYEKAYGQDGANLEEKKRVLIDIFKKIADKRADVNKSIWRVDHLCHQAEEITSLAKEIGIVSDPKELPSLGVDAINRQIDELGRQLLDGKDNKDSLHTRLEKTETLKAKMISFDNELKFSLKALHGLEKEDIITLSQVKVGYLRQRSSANVVRRKMKAEESEKLSKTQEISELIFAKAFE